MRVNGRVTNKLGSRLRSSPDYNQTSDLLAIPASGETQSLTQCLVRGETTPLSDH